jgi:hypothetical protein
LLILAYNTNTIMKAQIVKHIKVVDELGNIVEVKMWKLPRPAEDNPHGYKYSLVYIVDEVRVIGYDNAEGKGDHKHIKGKEEPYKFVNLGKLTKDFYKDIEKYKRGEL